MRISKKQLRLIVLLERSGGMFRNELAEHRYPKSLIDALIAKGLVSEFKGKLTSATLGT
jgi:hypothetical protein